jgi:hypothetical protein
MLAALESIIQTPAPIHPFACGKTKGGKRLDDDLTCALRKILTPGGVFGGRSKHQDVGQRWIGRGSYLQTGNRM